MLLQQVYFAQFFWLFLTFKKEGRTSHFHSIWKISQRGITEYNNLKSTVSPDVLEVQNYIFDRCLHTNLLASWIVCTVAFLMLEAKLLASNMTSGLLCIAAKRIWPTLDLSVSLSSSVRGESCSTDWDGSKYAECSFSEVFALFCSCFWSLFPHNKSSHFPHVLPETLTEGVVLQL